MREKVKKYFDAFSSKDVAALEEMYHDDISLRDWLSSATGKKGVIESNKRLFNACSSVSVKLKHLIAHSHKAACEIDINLIHNDGTEDKLLVVDIIEFEDDKVKEIRAYLGNV